MKLFISLCILCVIYTSQLAVALSTVNFPLIPPIYQPISLYMQTDFYSSVANYKNIGSYNLLPEPNYLQYTSLHPKLSYSPSMYLNFEIFANSFYIQTQTNNIERSQFQVTNLGIATSYYKKWARLYAGTEFRIAYPTSLYFSDLNSPIAGNHAFYMDLGLRFLYKISSNFYTYDNLKFRFRLFQSNVFFHSLGFLIKSQYMHFGLSANSFLSLFTYPYQRTPQDQAAWDKKIQDHNGGSYRFVSHNPSLLAFTAWTEFQINPVFIKIYFNTDSIGQNYAKGFTIGSLFTFRFNTRSAVLKQNNNKKGYINFDNSYQESYSEQDNLPYDKEDINTDIKNELRSLRN